MGLGAKHTSTLDTVYNLGNLYRDRGETAKAKKMYERAAKGYSDVEGDHEVDITYLREQLSFLTATDDKPEARCWPTDQQSFVPRGRTPARTSVLPGDIANVQSVGDATSIKGRKREIFRRLLKR
jgi:hypothetical protein